MRRFAIHQTEKRLNEMRQKHVVELEEVTGSVIQTSGVALIHQDDLALKKLQKAMESKRDQILRDENERIEYVGERARPLRTHSARGNPRLALFESVSRFA